ncbi:MAG: hypothetical protein M3N29_09400 [Chloroflexota bacterium]|nr:hypothetical protein [Chloroflexota bacterium]
MTPLFTDRDLGKRLAGILRALGVPATAHVERYTAGDAESIPDTRWIKDCAARGEVIVTRDSRQHRRLSAELRAIIGAGARAFVLETGNASVLEYLRALLIAWPRIQRIVDAEEGPWVYGVSSEGRLTRRHPPP